MNKYIKVVLVILALGGFAFIIHLNNEVEIVVKKNEIVLLQDIRTGVVIVYADTLEIINAYQTMESYPKSRLLEF